MTAPVVPNEASDNAEAFVEPVVTEPSGLIAPRHEAVPVGVVDVVVTLPNPNPILVLEEVDAPHRRLSIPIGAPEASAIAYALRGLQTPKPLTHDLFTTALAKLGATLAVARITGHDGAAYFAEIVISGGSGQHEIACRPSDAVALALRQRPTAPIVCVSALFTQVGRSAGDA